MENPEASDADVIAAAKSAHADGFIQQLAHGYDTEIGQRGVTLSGGQRQRLRIARVVLKDLPVLIFDEATSALDCEGELAVQRSLETMAQGRTTLVIAHRLSTVRHAQRIVVLTPAGIAEQGTHEALLARDGVYARLYAHQWVLRGHGSEPLVAARVRGYGPLRLARETLPMMSVTPDAY